MSYVVLRRRWCDIVVPNAHAPAEVKRDDSKDSFYEELGQVFNQFPHDHTETVLGDFNEKLGEGTFSN
jgi:hypothetical protein